MGPEGILAQIEADAREIIEKQPSIEGFSAAYNVSAAEFTVDGELIQPFPFNEDIPGSERVTISVAVAGEIEANHGPRAMKSWSGAEIFDQIAEYSDLNGDPERFTITVSFDPGK